MSKEKREITGKSNSELLTEAKVVTDAYIQKHGRSSYSQGREGQLYEIDGSPHVLVEDNGDRGMFKAIGEQVKNLPIKPTSLAYFSEIKTIPMIENSNTGSSKISRSKTCRITPKMPRLK